jgi:hypothetical protein
MNTPFVPQPRVAPTPGGWGMDRPNPNRGLQWMRVASRHGIDARDCVVRCSFGVALVFSQFPSRHELRMRVSLENLVRDCSDGLHAW